MKTIANKITLALFGASLLLASCTNLDEKPYNLLTAELWYQNRIQVEATVLRAYTHANAWAAPTGQTGSYRINELTADQIIWPQKGRHGYDGGDWGRLHYHTWTKDESAMRNPWNLLYTGLGFCNSTLGDFEKVDFQAIGLSEADKAGYIGELKALRAWHYMVLMNLYGNIPVVTKVGEPLSPPTEPRAKVFEFVESEFLSIVDGMFPLENKMAGRISKAAVYAMLADLYLNAETWSGTPRWDDCITYADMVISGAGGALNGTMQLDPNIDVWSDNDNATKSKEAIFQIAYDRYKGMWLGRGDYGAYGERYIVGNTYGGNNGMVTTPNAFFAYDVKDLRRYSWFYYGIGTNLGADKTPGTDAWRQQGEGYGGYNWAGPYRDVTATKASKHDYVIGTEEFSGFPLVFCFKPIKMKLDVVGGNVKITEWFSPEFPEESQKLAYEAALNSPSIKSNMIKVATDKKSESGDKAYVYVSGGYNTTDARQYPESSLNDYNHMWQDCKENTGARYNKYKIGPLTTTDGNNHFMIYRLTEIYFMKAEALMRKNGGVANQTAVDLINDCKKRAFLPEDWVPYTTATLTLDELIKERGREFIFEGKRRTDLIRFGKYEFATDYWWDATATPVGNIPNGSDGTLDKSLFRRLLPIPERQIQANKNLVQNDGYID